MEMSAQRREQIKSACQAMLESLLKECRPAALPALYQLQQTLHEVYFAAVDKLVEEQAERLAPGSGLTDHIEADRIAIEVTNKNNGRIFRRVLGISYQENNNGVMLTGENLAGDAVQIVFLSDSAQAKMNDLMGKGADSHRCR